MKGIFINIFNKFLTNWSDKKILKIYKKIMKKLIIIISILAILLIVFNIRLIDFNEFFSEKNTVAIVTIIAGLCCLILLRIVKVSNKIKNYNKEK
jgi:phosphotransferase system  glucose/maltose/N-acetylglucosamine-specific IIC component